MLKIAWKHITPPCMKNFISLFSPFPFFFSQNCIILHFQHNATCGADVFWGGGGWFTLRNWQPKHSAQETNILLEKNYKCPVNRNKSKERQAISFFSSKSQGTSPWYCTIQCCPLPIVGIEAGQEKQAGEEAQ